MSTYLESMLGAGERVEVEAKVSLWPALIMVVIGVLTLLIYVGAIFLIAAVIFFLRAKTTELGVTNKKVIGKWGLISRDSVELLLPKVEAIRVNQGLFGRILGYGTVIIAGSGNATPIPGISDPMGFRKKFMEIQERTTTSAKAV